MLVTRIFSLFAIAYGVLLYAIACGVDIPIIAQVSSEVVVGVTFVIAGIFFLPFVITYTKFGLNSPEGAPASQLTTLKQKKLERACPFWNIAWFGLLGLTTFIWLTGPLWGVIHPIIAFSAASSLLSGIWFLLVYPIAQSLFSSKPRSR